VTEGILSGTARSLVIAFDAPFYGLAPLLPTGQRGRLVNVAGHGGTARPRRPRAG
jgi:hypothetical protein